MVRMYEKGCMYYYVCMSQISDINDFVKLKNLRNELFVLFTYKIFSQIWQEKFLTNMICVGCSQGFHYVFGPKLLMLEIQLSSSLHCVGWASGIS